MSPDTGGAVLLEPPEPERPVVDLEAKVAELEARRELSNLEIILDGRERYAPSDAFERRYYDFETKALERRIRALRRDVEVLKAIGATS